MASTKTATFETSTELPEPGVWTIDPSHSSIELSVRHLVAAKVRGRFGDFAGTIQIADDPAASSVQVEIQTASIDTRNADRDAHLRSDDFFATDTYPTATYRSTALRPSGKDRFEVDGELTVHGVSKPVTLEGSYHGPVQDPWGNQRIVFSASGEINREDFGLTWNQALETGGVLVVKTAKLDIDVEAVRQQ